MFKTGDRVRCVLGSSVLRAGEEYDVWGVDPNTGYVQIVNSINGNVYSYVPERFELVKPLPLGFRKGDRVRCVRGNRFLRKGREYTVQRVSYLNCIEVEAGSDYFWFPERFERAHTSEVGTFPFLSPGEGRV